MALKNNSNPHSAENSIVNQHFEDRIDFEPFTPNAPNIVIYATSNGKNKFHLHAIKLGHLLDKRTLYCPFTSLAKIKVLSVLEKKEFLQNTFFILKKDQENLNELDHPPFLFTIENDKWQALSMEESKIFAESNYRNKLQQLPVEIIKPTQKEANCCRRLFNRLLLRCCCQVEVSPETVPQASSLPFQQVQAHPRAHSNVTLRL